MSLLIYGVAFWIIAIISSILQDRFPDVAVASYQTVVKAIPTVLALAYVLYTLPSGSLFYILLAIALFRIVDKLTPSIPFLSINKSPEAVGIYVFGYLVFLGLILHAALTAPL